MTKTQYWLRAVTSLICLCGAFRSVSADVSSRELVVSVRDQALELFENGQPIARYRISTSRFGVGDAFGSYKTPLGELAVKTKIGDHLAPGTVLKGRCPTGEVLKPNSPGRDPIVTRIIWLEGLEPQNSNAYERGIYIHGTPEESHLGSPVSWGCIRMSSRDVAQLYDELPVGTPVIITEKRLAEMRNLQPPEMPARSIETLHPLEPAPASRPIRFAFGMPSPRPVPPSRGFPIAFDFRDLRCTGVLAYRASATDNATLDPNLIRLAATEAPRVAM